MNTLIIIPCYNEAQRLPINDFDQFLKSHPEISLFFVDDGSQDCTDQILQNLCCRHSNADWLKLTANCGKAEAVRQGILRNINTNARFIGFFDADLATPLDELPAMLNCAKDSTLYISGCRLARLGSNIKRYAYRHFIGRIFATAAALYLDLPVYDTQCGAKIFDKKIVFELFQTPFATKWLFDVELLARMIRIYGKEQVIENCIEYPLHCWIDKGESKVRFFAVLMDFIRLLFKKN